jgi:hypothetical protein
LLLNARAFWLACLVLAVLSVGAFVFAQQASKEPSAAPKVLLTWTLIPDDDDGVQPYGEGVYYAKIAHGWLVVVRDGAQKVQAAVFIADPQHSQVPVAMK